MLREKKHKKPLNIQWHYMVSLILVLTILAVYFQVRQFEFLVYDDNLYVTENYAVRAGLSQQGIRWAFKETYAANWHPLTWVSHMADVQLYGLNPGAHHLTNLLIHILNAVLLFHVFRKMTGALWRSAFVAALFALHPLHVESVAWIAGRKDVLSTFFWLVTMFSYTRYVKHPTIWRYISVIIFFALGLMAKPMVVTLPFVLLLLDYWPFGRLSLNQLNVSRGSGCPKKIFFRLVIEKVPFFILTIASCVVTFIAQIKGGAVESIIRYPLIDRLTNALVSYTRYILKMIWPANLTAFYPHPGAWPFWQFAGAFLFLALIFILVVKNYRKKPYLPVGWLWYIGTLVPVIGMVQVGKQAMADRYTYIPLIGLFVMITWGAEELLKRRRYRSFGLATAGVVLLLILITASWQQTGYWQNSIKLFQHAVEVTTDNITAHNNLGIALAREGDPAKAIDHYLIVLKNDPNHAITHINLGNALFSLGKITEAEVHYYKALRLNPRHPRAHNNLANAMAHQGKTVEAIQHYLEALTINPEYTDARYNLGNIFMEQGRFDEAIEQYITVLRIDPYYTAAQKNIAVTLAKQRRFGVAIISFSEPLNMYPEDKSLKDDHKKINEKMKKIEKSIAEIKSLLKKKTYDPEVYMIIGNLYQSKGDLNSAEAYYQKAILIEPEFYEAIKNQASIKALQGKYDQARNLFEKLITLQPDLPEGFYLIAATYARQNRIESAIDWLVMAVERGFNDWDLLETDQNLERIRTTSYYEELLRTR